MKQTKKNKGIVSLAILGTVIMNLAIWGYVGYLLVAQQVQIYKYNKQSEQLNNEIASQEKETKKLRHSIELNKSDEFIEKQARERLGYVKPDERVYIDKSQKN